MWVTVSPERFNFTMKVQPPDQIPKSSRFFFGISTTSPYRLNQKSEFNAEDLKSVLNKLLSNRDDIKSDGFSLKTCKEMINLLDVDNTGTLSSEEYKILWRKLEHYMKIFLEADANFSGTIDAHEMRNALLKAGFNLNNRIQEVIVQRCVSGELNINFEDFIACMIRLETLFKMFKIMDTDKDGNVSLSLSEVILCISGTVLLQAFR
ncbi:unnamed protein product [Ranitomeya imitator]|uniref:EF-hand domain-containing protein n=1 Tax=Ranitomeya imitator TaxID=111125 RepID=A0ABN9M5A6_9NEOB|nr:unnamed protein product [Ranitomeya imitator]